MTVAADRLRTLVNASTPGPWRIAYDPLTATFYFRGIEGTTDDDPDARLVALAPALASLCADMGDALAEWEWEGEDIHGNFGGCLICTGDRDTDHVDGCPLAALLARLDELVAAAGPV